MTTTRFTTRDIDAFPDNQFYRYEIMDGELYVTKAPSWEHQIVSGNIIKVLGTWDEDARLGEVGPAPGLVFAEDEAVIPDVVGVRRDRRAGIVDGAGHFTGPPDLVVEILSPGVSNRRRDREIKLDFYNRWGVPEYWIVDWEARLLEIYRGGLNLAAILHEGDLLTSPLLPGFSCPVTSLFRGLPTR